MKVAANQLTLNKEIFSGLSGCAHCTHKGPRKGKREVEEPEPRLSWSLLAVKLDEGPQAKESGGFPPKLDKGRKQTPPEPPGEPALPTSRFQPKEATSVF